MRMSADHPIIEQSQSSSPSTRRPNVPGRRVERWGLSLARPWRSPGDPEFRRSGIVIFTTGLVIGLLTLAVVAIGGGLPDPWIWAFALAIIITDGTELPVASLGGEYKIVINDVFALVAIASFSTHDTAWLLLLATALSPLLLPLSWSMRFAHAASGLMYRTVMWGAAVVAVAAGASPLVAVVVMVIFVNVYDLTLFRPFAHVLLRAPDQSWGEYLQEAWPSQLLLTSVNLPLAIVGINAIDSAPWSVPLLAIPLLVIWRLALLGPRLSELRETERMKATFVSMASHELQTPLTSVIGFAETLDQRWDAIDDAERRRFLRIIRDQGRRLSRLVTDLLVLSNLDAEIERPRDEIVDLSNALQLAIRDAAVAVDADSVSMSAGVRVLAGEDDVVRVLVNLLSNAGKYGRPPITVQVATSSGWVTVRVIDQGDGITEADRAHVFDHFVRGTDLPSHVEGSGLGLAISRALARAHGGELRYENVPEAGSCFALSLPAAPSEPDTPDRQLTPQRRQQQLR
jgi:signal transduction histidine kinase